MPRISEAFPSKYLAADVDIRDQDEGGTIYTISGADFAMVGQGDDAESKLVLYFHEVDKGLVLNKTNATTIAGLFKSDDTDDWIGKQIKMFAKDVEFSGKMVRGIRVSTRPVNAPAPARPARPAVKQVAPVPPVEPGDDSDIPF